MAIYSGLHELAESVVEHVKTLGGVFTGTLYGQPPDSPISSTDAARVTLLWVTPQPTHRNDAPFRNLAGAVEPPPITLSAYLMITTYGGGADNPATAYQMLGEVLRLFHERPLIPLPIAGVGEGTLTMSLVPTAADLMEKVFSPIQIKHRPFVIYEAGPIQLRPLVPLATSAPPVKPGGIGLDVVARPAPAIVRITPERQVAGGAVRIDLELGGATLAALAIGGTTVAATPIPGTTAVRAIIPPTTAGPAAAFAVRTSPAPGLWSDAYPIAIVPPTPAPSTIDALAVDASPMGAALALAGRGLGAATSAFIWPDGGAPADGDVRELPLASVGSTAVSIGGAAITTAVSASPGQRSLVGQPLRLVLRLATGLFTPYVLVRFVP